MTAKITLLRTDICPVHADALVCSLARRRVLNEPCTVNEQAHCEVHVLEEENRRSGVLDTPSVTAKWRLDIALPERGPHNKKGTSQAYQIFCTLFSQASALGARNLAIMSGVDQWLSDATQADYGSLLNAMTQAASHSPVIRKVIVCVEQPQSHKRWLEAFEQSLLH